MLITVLLGLASWAVTVTVASVLIGHAERRRERAGHAAADFASHPDADELRQIFADVLAESPPPDATDPRPHLP